MLSKIDTIFEKLVLMSYILHDVYNYNLLKFIRSTMNDRLLLFEDEPHLSLKNDQIKNSSFNLSPVRLDGERKFAIFQSTKCFNVAPVQCCVPISDYAF